jgi:WD repeat-containing protein 17
VPWLLLSGSWDCTIRAWDVRNGGSCIAVMHQHIADVYSIVAHPARPFVFVSASRDTALRFFTLEGIATAAKVLLLLYASYIAIAIDLARY